jgi:hypothetical protein
MTQNEDTNKLYKAMKQSDDTNDETSEEKLLKQNDEKRISQN